MMDPQKIAGERPRAPEQKCLPSALFCALFGPLLDWLESKGLTF